MNLFEYVRILRRRGWIIVLAILITATSAYFYSKAQTTIYRASQKVSVQPARNDFGLTQTLVIFLRNYVITLDTEENARKVIDRLELDMTPGALRSYTTINSDPTTLIIQIDIDLTDSALAAEIAHEYGQLLVEWRNEQNSDSRREDRIEAALLDYPIPGLHRPKTRTNVMAAAILGLLIGGIVVFVLEYLESNILRSPRDIERWLDIPVMAAIVNEPRGN